MRDNTLFVKGRLDLVDHVSCFGNRSNLCVNSVLVLSSWSYLLIGKLARDGLAHILRTFKSSVWFSKAHLQLFYGTKTASIDTFSSLTPMIPNANQATLWKKWVGMRKCFTVFPNTHDQLKLTLESLSQEPPEKEPIRALAQCNPFQQPYPWIYPQQSPPGLLYF